MTLVLTDQVLSADCYKVRLALGFLGLAHEIVPADAASAVPFEGDEPPILNDGPHTVAGALPILRHLAASAPVWSPEPAGQGAAFALSAALADSCGIARKIVNFGVSGDLAAARSGARTVLRGIDETLWFGARTGNPWLLPGPQPTFAEIACFPDIALAGEGGIDLGETPAIRLWCERVRRLPGFSVMPGVFPAGPGH
ncbi:glutathione S-transferase [Acuticoccus sp. MNP-M23]|uniref:glutathione S-transferase n=1 Tax=Acuticoccus sp. MNP-M23 TaxID=3072793 RepID=UPI0028161C4A|nr:glutathione S-transferase [Acuticoccus sp. MNP-M23]WMS44719.1 glutathione S-transferase [Acuticoccus sp. MNP-M23]